MSVLGALADVGKLLLEHSDVIGDVVEELSAGSPKDAIRAAIRGVRVQVSRDALAEEFGSAANRNKADHGAIAYAAYAASTGWKNYAGGQMPVWIDLPPHIRAAWEAAADAARSA